MLLLNIYLCLLQWFAITRRHALLILADNLYYNKFKLYCKVCSLTYAFFNLMKLDANYAFNSFL
jgi:hypothetical protein